MAPQLGQDRADVEMGPGGVRVLDAAELNVEDLQKEGRKRVITYISNTGLDTELNVEDVEDLETRGLHNKFSKTFSVCELRSQVSALRGNFPCLSVHMSRVSTEHHR